MPPPDGQSPPAAYDHRRLYAGHVDEQKLVNSKALAALVDERDRLWASLADIASHDLNVDYADVELRNIARRAIGIYPVKS